MTSIEVHRLFINFGPSKAHSYFSFYYIYSSLALMVDNAAYINRSLSTVRNVCVFRFLTSISSNRFQELEFLKESNVITPALYEKLSSQFSHYTLGSSPIDIDYRNLAGSHSNPSNEKSSYTMPNSGEKAEVSYNYSANGPNDLPLHAGQQIQIIEEVNTDWWRGRDLQTGQEGLFPSNYVRIVGSREQPRKSANSYPIPSDVAKYGDRSQLPAPQQLPYPPPSTNYYNSQSQQVQQQQPQQVQAPQEEKHHHHVSNGAKKFGDKMGNAAIFGAGASIGNKIVDNLF